MNGRQKRLLDLLDGLIEECQDCTLHLNGKALPYWTPISQYLIIGEAPGKNEVEDGEPFVGRAGQILWDAMAKYGFRRDEFGIINRVQCRPMDGGKNGKPTPLEMTHCVKWVRKFIKCLDPKGIILLGNYAKSLIDGKNGGIEQFNAKTFLVPNTLTERDIYCVFSVHPAVGIYDGQAGIEKLEKAIQRFKEICS